MWSKYNHVTPSVHTEALLNADQSSSFQVYTGVSDSIAMSSNYYFGVQHSQILSEHGKELVNDENSVFYYSRSKARCEKYKTGHASILAVYCFLPTFPSKFDFLIFHACYQPFCVSNCSRVRIRIPTLTQLNKSTLLFMVVVLERSHSRRAWRQSAP